MSTPPSSADPVQELGAGVWRIPTPLPFRPREVHAYLAQLRDGEFLLVDGGADTAAAWGALDGAVRRLAGAWERVKLHLVTHMHLDHLGLARRVREASGARLLMGRLDAERAAHAEAEPEEEAEYRERLLRENGAPRAVVAEIQRGSARSAALSVYVPANVLLDGNEDELPGAAPWRWVWTPGHTAGHLCLFRAADGLLISGDAVLPRVTPTIGVNRQRADPVADYLGALARLAALRSTRILPGHGEPIEEPERRIHELREATLREREEVLARTSAEPRTAWQIAALRHPAADLPAATRMLALRETLAHLRHLETAGLVGSTRDADDVAGSGGAVYFARRGDPLPPTSGSMLSVGLTGNIAAGKSSVARVWASLGAAVVDADELARRAVAPGSPALAEIATEWGAELLDADGALDRPALREIVFRDPVARERLEAIVHPAVRRLRDEEFAAAASRGENVVVADIPLLFETGLQDEFDLVVLVDAPEPVRLHRLERDRGIGGDEARRMVAAQIPAELKRARADLIIENDGSREALEARARDAWRLILERAATHADTSGGVGSA